MSDGSRHSVRMIKETVYGVTPATPTFKTIRQKSCTLALSKNTSQSEELREDRQIADQRHGASQVGGELGIELSCKSFDDILEAVMCDDWSGDVLKAGVLRKSFTIERYFADLGGANKPFHRFTGCEFNAMSLSVTPDSRVTGSFTILGKAMNTDTTIIVGSSVDAPEVTPGLDSFTGALTEGGAGIAVITEISMNIANGLEPRFVVGSKETVLPSIGQCNINGQITAYFENSTLLDKFINEDESSIEFTLPDALGNSLKFTLPKVKYNGGQPDVSGPGAILLTMPFQALFDTVSGTNLQITRVSV